jgi:hypothetical protein
MIISLNVARGPAFKELPWINFFGITATRTGSIEIPGGRSCLGRCPRGVHLRARSQAIAAFCSSCSNWRWHRCDCFQAAHLGRYSGSQRR